MVSTSLCPLSLQTIVSSGINLRCMMPCQMEEVSITLPLKEFCWIIMVLNGDGNIYMYDCALIVSSLILMWSMQVSVSAFLSGCVGRCITSLNPYEEWSAGYQQKLYISLLSSLLSEDCQSAQCLSHRCFSIIFQAACSIGHLSKVLFILRNMMLLKHHELELCLP